MKHLVGSLVLIGIVCGGIFSGHAADEKTRFAKFEKDMSGVKLVDQFTVDGGGKQVKEEYTILKVIKLPAKDLWLFTARVKYGKIDLTLPMPIPVKWAGDTPVISMDKLKIPLLGTFSAQVVLDGNRYAGTWQHGKVGGHLFGSIEKVEKEKK